MLLKTKKHSANLVFVLVSAAVFAGCLLLVLLFGAQGYQKIAQASQERYEKSVPLQFLTTKVRQNDGGGIRIGEIGGIPALIFTEEIDGAAYETALYAYDGWLRELFYEKGLKFLPEDGEKLIEAEAVSFQIQERSLLRIDFTGANQNAEFCLIHLYSGEGDAS
jgi:hypothetical protein